MNILNFSWVRWHLRLVGVAVLLLFLGATGYVLSQGAVEGLSPYVPEQHSLGPDGPQTVEAAPSIEVEQLYESWARALGQHFDKWGLRNTEALKENWQMQAQAFKEWQFEFDGQAEEQALRLEDVGQRLREVERGMGRLLDSFEKERASVAAGPAFAFRGIEIWHGQIYALLEYEGRILPVRQGESRLGWRVYEIDRENRQLHISDGMTAQVLEER